MRSFFHDAKTFIFQYLTVATMIIGGMVSAEAPIEKGPNYNPYDQLFLNSTTFEPEFLEPRILGVQLGILYKFFHGATGTFAYQSFYYDLESVYVPGSTLYAYVLDCFCSGDMYQVWINGNLLTVTNSVNNPYYPANPTVPTPCSYYAADSTSCATSTKFSKIEYRWTMERYANVSIQVALSPFRNGAGFFSIHV